MNSSKSQDKRPLELPLLHAKILLKRIPSFLFAGIYVGMLLAFVAIFTRERTIKSVRNKDVDIITSMASTFVRSYTPVPEEWESVFKPLMPAATRGRGDALMGVSIWKNGKPQYVNHGRLALAGIDEMKQLSVNDRRYSLKELNVSKNDKWHIGFFRPEQKYDFALLDEKTQDGVGYYLSPLSMFIIPVRMLFDPDIHGDVNFAAVYRTGLPPFLLGFTVIVFVFMIFMVKDYRHMKILAEKESEKIELSREIESIENAYRIQDYSKVDDGSMEIQKKKIDMEIELLGRFFESVDEKKLRYDYDHFLNGFYEFYELKQIPEEFHDPGLDMQIRETSLFFVLSDYVEYFKQTALTRYATMTEYFFRLVYTVKAKHEVEAFRREWKAASPSVRNGKIKQEFSEDAIKTRAKSLGLDEALRVSLVYITLALKNPDVKVFQPMERDSVGAASYITFWLLPLFVKEIDTAKEYALPILRALEKNGHLFEQINDMVNYRNQVIHGRTSLFDMNERTSLRLWHEQFMSVFNSLGTGYADRK